MKQEGFFGKTKNIVLINSSYSGVKTSIEKLKLIHLALVSLGFGTNESCGKSASVQQKSCQILLGRLFFMVRFIFQFGAASAVFLFSTIAAWYEGSAILDKPLEWRNSTPITQLMYGAVHESSNILQWDFFIYAAKYQPTFPMIMTVSGLYLLVFLGYYIFKKVRKWYAFYLFLIGGALFLLSYFSFESSTVGGQKMFVLFTVCGSFCILTGLITYLMTTMRMKRVK